MLSRATERELNRWYPLKDHPVQNALVTVKKRFKVIPAGRRSGKTERFKRFVVREAMRKTGLYFAAAPTHNQAKRIFWKDLKTLSFCSTHFKRPSESELIIYYPNESELHVVGLDKPERFEGQPWTGGGVDEFPNIKDGAWEENISPALNTVNPLDPDFRAWVWLFGVPDGLNHYYDVAKYAESGIDDDWGYFHWPSSDILPADIIEGEKRRLSKRQYNQEYNATFETAAGRIYEDYTGANHTDETIKKKEQIIWTHDQNFTPLSSAIIVERKKKINKKDLNGLIIVGEFEEITEIYILDEIILESAISKQSAVEFVERYKNHKNKHILVYGDPSGKDGEKHGHDSDYIELEKVLVKHGWTFERRVAKSHPAIKNRQNAVRAKVCNTLGERTLFVNPVKAPYCDKGLSTVQAKKGSSFQEDDKNKHQHITTAIGYYIYYEFPTVDRGFNVKINYHR